MWDLEYIQGLSKQLTLVPPKQNLPQISLNLLAQNEPPAESTNEQAEMCHFTEHCAIGACKVKAGFNKINPVGSKQAVPDCQEEKNSNWQHSENKI